MLVFGADLRKRVEQLSILSVGALLASLQGLVDRLGCVYIHRARPKLLELFDLQHITVFHSSVPYIPGGS